MLAYISNCFNDCDLFIPVEKSIDSFLYSGEEILQLVYNQHVLLLDGHVCVHYLILTLHVVRQTSLFLNMACNFIALYFRYMQSMILHIQCTYLCSSDKVSDTLQIVNEQCFIRITVLTLCGLARPSEIGRGCPEVGLVWF